MDDIFPLHKVSLHLTHNDHKGVYRTVAQSVDDGDFGYTDDCWISDEQKEKAIANNECWTVQWYPETTVGFLILSAHDLDALLEEARK